MRRFFICSVGEPGKDYIEDNFQRIVSESAFYMHEDTTQKGLYNEIQPGDILILKYNSNYVAYGETTGIRTVENNSGWIFSSPVKTWYFFDNDNYKKGVNSYGVSWETLAGSGQMGTVKGITPEFGFLKVGEISSDSELYRSLFIETKKGRMEKTINLLKYKKQIILQGPPGTGKTRLAKELANNLIGNKKTISPLKYVENFIQNYKLTDQSSKIDLISDNLLSEFKDTFSLEKIKDLSIDDYTLGNGSQDSFCYWIEQKLAHTCKFSPGGAGTTVYGISYNKESGDLRVDDDQNPDDFMAKVRVMLSDLVEKEDYTKAREMKFWYSLILKILHSYNPDRYFPVLSKDHLKLFAKIFEIDPKGLDDIVLNKKINEAFYSLKNQSKSTISSVVLMRHLYEKFKIKEGNLTEPYEVEAGINVSGNYKIIQFHPSYTYEDFVRGISAASNSKSQIEYKVVNKALTELAEEALLNKEEKYVLIIDEINRANLSSVLGELIYALEYRYFFNDSIEKKLESEVESIYGLKDENGTTNRVLKLPENLYIIGTMNTADRSVGHIDYAIRRRFAFRDVLPENLKITQGLKNFDENLFLKVADLFDTNLSQEFHKNDVQLGHSYFIDKFDEGGSMDIRFQYEIKPILLEYVKDGVLIGKKKGKSGIEIPLAQYIHELSS